MEGNELVPSFRTVWNSASALCFRMRPCSSLDLTVISTAVSPGSRMRQVVRDIDLFVWRGRRWSLEDKGRVGVGKIADEGVASDSTLSPGTCVAVRVWKCTCS